MLTEVLWQVQNQDCHFSGVEYVPYEMLSPPSTHRHLPGTLAGDDVEQGLPLRSVTSISVRCAGKLANVRS